MRTTLITAVSLMALLVLSGHPLRASIGSGAIDSLQSVGFYYATGDVGYIETQTYPYIGDAAYVVDNAGNSNSPGQLVAVTLVSQGSMYTTGNNNHLASMTGVGQEGAIDILVSGGAITESQFTSPGYGFAFQAGDTGNLAYLDSYPLCNMLFPCPTYIITAVNDLGSIDTLSATGGNNIAVAFTSNLWETNPLTGNNSDTDNPDRGLNYAIVSVITDGSLMCPGAGPGPAFSYTTPCGYVIYAYPMVAQQGSSYQVGDIGQVLSWLSDIDTGTYVVTELDGYSGISLTGFTFSLTHGYYPGPAATFPDTGYGAYASVVVYRGAGLPPDLF